MAYYLYYVGGMAFNNLVRVPSELGGIMDQMATCGPDNIVMEIFYHHYAAEVVRV